MGVFYGNFNPDATFTSDIGSITRLATSAPFGRYLQEEIFQQSAFYTSGILAADARLNNTIGTRVELPFFAPLNYIEERVDSSDTWGLNQSGYYTSQKTKASTQYGTITTRGAMFAADDLHTYQTGEDALANIRSQLARDMARKMNQKLISQVWGLLSADGAPLNETHVCDVSTCTGDVTIGNTLSPTSVTGAKYLLGERANTLDAIAVHPDVAAWLETAGMLTYTNVTDTSNAASSIWGSGGIGLSSTQVALFAGLQGCSRRAITRLSATLTVLLNTHCYLFGNGVVRTGQQFPLNIETERNIASLQDVFAVTYSQPDARDGNLLDLQLRRSHQRAAARSLQLEPRLLRSPSDSSRGTDRECRRCLFAYHRHLRLIGLGHEKSRRVSFGGPLFLRK